MTSKHHAFAQGKTIRGTGIASLILILMMLLVVGCAPAVPTAGTSDEDVAEASTATESGPVEGGSLIVAFNGEPTSLDCQSGNLFNSRITAHNICETLVREDTTAVGQTSSPIVPGLAESWEISEDGLVYTFKLREGISFTDGTPFDSAAVAAAFDRYLNEDSIYYNAQTAAGMGNLTAVIDSYSAVDEYTFEITLKEAAGFFLFNLTHRTFGIMSPTALAEWTSEMTGEHIVGTGPFIFSEQIQGDRVVLVKNPDYWNKDEGGPYLDRVVFTVMPDDSARLAALQTGDIDVSIVVPPDRVADISSDPNITVVPASNAHIMFWQVNHLLPELQDPLVRQAIMQAIDTEGMVASIFGDNAVPMRSFLPPGNPLYRPDFESPFPYDPERAKELLTEAGYAPGELTLILAYPIKAGSYAEPGPVAQWTQSNLIEAGFAVELDPYEFAAFGDAFRGKGLADVHMKMTGWQSIAGYPYMLEQLFACASVAGDRNGGAYCSEEFDALVAQARSLQLEDAAPFYLEAEDILLADVGTIPILHDTQPRAYHNRVKNLLFGPSPWWELTNVWVEE